MTTPTPGATWQQADLATSFLERRGEFVPMLDVQEDIVVRLLERRGRTISRFLDLGCGDGAMTQLVIDAHPSAEVVMVDFSEPMLERAGERLRRMRVQGSLWRADLNERSWSEVLPDVRYDAIVSGLAIHHLPSERKRELYAELFDLLEPGGVFVNMDYVLVEGPLQGLFDERKADALAADRDAAGASTIGQVIVDEDDDDRPDLAETQVQWLREAGFEHAEVQFKWAEAAVLAGFKPDREER
ncbi:MAG TPA: class I SAM-dependent methyltransferase [Solirubrobacteraceae bacterium]|nr:class I SAM-dependent methyltransferase [Solirubrobacteraceae bacterium]